MANCDYAYRTAPQFVFADNHATPQIECLADFRQILCSNARTIHNKGQLPEVQPMRILSQPPIQLLLPLPADRIRNRMSMNLHNPHLEIINRLTLRQRGRMPTPLRKRIAIERLQPGDIDPERNFTVPNLRNFGAVGLRERNIMTFD